MRVCECHCSFASLAILGLAEGAVVCAWIKVREDDPDVTEHNSGKKLLSFSGPDLHSRLSYLRGK